MGVVGDDLERPAAYVGDVVQRQSVRGSVQPRLDHPRQVLERERGAAHTTRGDQDVDGGEIGVVPGQHDPRLDRLSLERHTSTLQYRVNLVYRFLHEKS